MENNKPKNQINQKNKSKSIAVVLYIFLSVFCIGDLYLGYKDKFKNQILRIVLFVILAILAFAFDLNFFFVAWFVWLWVCIACWGNVIKGFRILFGNIKTDSNGIELK